MDVQDFLTGSESLENLSLPVCLESGRRLFVLPLFSFFFCPDLFPNLPVCCQGDVWICMELMDTSLDKFYKQVIEKGLTIPEDILGKIAVSVGSLKAA